MDAKKTIPVSTLWNETKEVMEKLRTPPTSNATTQSQMIAWCEALGCAVRRSRRRAGLSIADLAARLDRDVLTTHCLERGVAATRIRTFFLLARTLDLSPGDLLVAAWYSYSERRYGKLPSARNALLYAQLVMLVDPFEVQEFTFHDLMAAACKAGHEADCVVSVAEEVVGQ